MSPEDFSLTKFLENPLYSHRFKKYFRRNIFLDTYAFCLVVLGKFDDVYTLDTLGGEDDFFMNIDTYKKLMRILDRYKGKLIVTPAVVVESLNHMFDAIDNKYKGSADRKDIEAQFAEFLQNEIKLFKEKHPRIRDMLNHDWTETIKHHKLRDRFEAGDLSIFVESDACKYATIVTNDEFRVDKGILPYQPENAILIQLGVLAII